MKRVGPPPPRPKLPVKELAELIAVLVIGHIRDRCGRGLDIHDAVFIPYSEEYKETLIRLGRNTTPVDLLLSGGLLGSVKIVERDAASVTLGVDTGTSPVVRPPTKSKAKRKVSGKRGPSHNLLAAWHQEGAGRNPKREWFGVSPSGAASIDRQIDDAKPPVR